MAASMMLVLFVLHSLSGLFSRLASPLGMARRDITQPLKTLHTGMLTAEPEKPPKVQYINPKA